jgi:hypothetical protein
MTYLLNILIFENTEGINLHLNAEHLIIMSILLGSCFI